MDKCINCGHSSMMPFYCGYKEKRFKIVIKDESKCPQCKKTVMTNEDFMNEKEKEIRQVGQFSLCCNIPYIKVWEWGHKSICKKCGKNYFNKEVK